MYIYRCQTSRRVLRCVLKHRTNTNWLDTTGRIVGGSSSISEFCLILDLAGALLARVSFKVTIVPFLIFLICKSKEV